MYNNQKYRDAIKALTAMTDGNAAYCILAVENEGKINYAMPVKNGLYDFLQLSRQVTSVAKLHSSQSEGDVCRLQRRTPEIHCRLPDQPKGSILTCRQLKLSQAETKKLIMLEYEKSSEEADELLNTYWK